MVASPPLYARMRTVWDLVAPRFLAYQLVLPGTPAFHCDPLLCDAQCCRLFSVNLGDREVQRFAREHRVAPIDFLECEDGKPIALPLAQPYVLARENGACKQLARPALSCTTYEGRPNACRLYPHFVVFVDPATARPVHGDLEGMLASFAALPDAEPAPYVPLLLRHTDCPGSTGAPMDAHAWWNLTSDTFRLQYADSQD